MNRRVVRVLLLLYPKAWRERYGEELGTLCQELVERGEATRLRLAVGLALSAFVEHLRCALVAATLRRRSFTRFVAGVLAAAATAMVLVSTAVFGPLAPAGAVTLCEPHITHVGTVPPGQDPDVTITGTCFGTGGAFNGFSDHFGITDLGPRGTLGELENVALAQPTWWDACAATTDANKGVSLSVVSCSVPAWTNTSITFKSFGGEYGASHWVVDAGDKVVVQVWNANAPVSASWCLVPVVAKGAPGPGTTCASVLVAGQPVVNGGSTALHVRADQFGARPQAAPGAVGLRPVPVPVVHQRLDAGGDCRLQSELRAGRRRRARRLPGHGRAVPRRWFRLLGRRGRCGLTVGVGLAGDLLRLQLQLAQRAGRLQLGPAL